MPGSSRTLCGWSHVSPYPIVDGTCTDVLFQRLVHQEKLHRVGQRLFCQGKPYECTPLALRRLGLASSMRSNSLCVTYLEQVLCVREFVVQRIVLLQAFHPVPVVAALVPEKV